MVQWSPTILTVTHIYIHKLSNGLAHPAQNKEVIKNGELKQQSQMLVHQALMTPTLFGVKMARCRLRIQDAVGPTYEGFHKCGIPKNRWFIREILLK